MLIGELARATGLTKDTIRYYTQLGVINADQKPAGNKKYADYDESTVALLGHVKLGKRKQEIEEMEKIVTEMLMTFD